MLNKWMRQRREQTEKRNMKQASDYFGGLLKKGRIDAGAVRQSIEDYKDFPSVTEKQTELLLKHKFFRHVEYMGYPERKGIMDALKDTRYGVQTGTEIPHNMKAAADSPLFRLLAQYRVLESEYVKRNAHEPLSADAQADKDAAHRLLNYCMGESDLTGLKDFALKGTRPEDSVIIRYGLLDGYHKIEELHKEWSEEQLGDNHTVMDRIELQIASEKGKLMQQAAGIYEKRMAGKLPDDYRKTVQEERGLLWELSRSGWNENLKVPVEMQAKYGMAGDFAGIADWRFDYKISMDMGDYDRDYPQEAIDRHSRAIREQAGKELEKLEARLFSEKAESRERKAASAGTENRVRPSPSVRQEQKAQPGKGQNREPQLQQHNSPQPPKRVRIRR